MLTPSRNTLVALNAFNRNALIKVLSIDKVLLKSFYLIKGIIFQYVIANDICTGLILGLRPANERRRYKVTPSLIGWAQAWNQPCMQYFDPDVNTVYDRCVWSNREFLSTCIVMFMFIDGCACVNLLNRPQVISNHHTDSTVTTVSH